MAIRRYVKQNASGSWDVLREGERRSVVQAQSRSKAMARARDLVRSEGGGEIRVMNEMGKIVISNTVTARPAKAARSRRSG